MTAYQYRIPGLSQIGPGALKKWDLESTSDAIENAFDEYLLYPEGGVKCEGDMVSFSLTGQDLRDLDRHCREHVETRKGMLALILEEGVADLVDHKVEVTPA